jgi:hypothetical protein
MRRVSRTRFALLVAGILASSSIVSGCTVAVTGIAGVGIDAKGSLVGYIQMCREHINQATFYDIAGSHAAGQGAWSFVAPVTGFAKWSLVDTGDGWSTTQAFVPPTDGHEYALNGWTTDDSYSARAVEFRLTDLAGLQPGDVLYTKGGQLQRTTEDGFRHQACTK